MRLIDADALEIALGHLWRATAPRDTDDKEISLERAAMCRGIDDCIGIVQRAPTIGGWISAYDRLPEGRGEIYAEGLEDSAKVLAACITQDGRRKCGLATYVRDHELPGDSGWCGIIDETEAIDDRYTKVTHWMPLPEWPEVDRDND